MALSDAPLTAQLSIYASYSLFDLNDEDRRVVSVRNRHRVFLNPFVEPYPPELSEDAAAVFDAVGLIILHTEWWRAALYEAPYPAFHRQVLEHWAQFAHYQGSVREGIQELVERGFLRYPRRADADLNFVVVTDLMMERYIQLPD